MKINLIGSKIKWGSIGATIGYIINALADGVPIIPLI